MGVVSQQKTKKNNGYYVKRGSTNIKARSLFTKVFTLFWWNMKDIASYELLEHGRTINKDTYCQPDLVNGKDFIPEHDNSRSHTAKN